jgi:two-component system response regulator CpxR
MKVLMLEGDRDFAFSLAGLLGRSEIDILITHDLITAHTLNRALNFDAAVLDASLLQQDIGHTTFLEDDTPVVLMKTSQSEYQFALDAGIPVQACLAKPFEARELISALRQLPPVKAPTAQAQHHYMFDDLELLPQRFEALVGNLNIALTGAECRILQLLLTSRDMPLTRHRLYQEGLLRKESPLDRSLDVHMSNLRKKLGPHPTKGNRIRAVRGLGYALV